MTIHSPKRVWCNCPPCPCFFCQSSCFFTFYGWRVPPTQESPMFLAKYTLISKFNACPCCYCSYHACMVWNDASELGQSFFSVSPSLEDSWYSENCYLISKCIILIFILPYNQFGTYLFVLVLWFFKGLLEEGVSGFKCRSA